MIKRIKPLTEALDGIDTGTELSLEGGDMKAIDKIKKLKKSEIIHLIESTREEGQDLIDSLKSNRNHQILKNHSCHECRTIAVKLGIEK